MMHRRRDLLRLASAAALAAIPRAARPQDATLPPRWQPGDQPPDVEGVHLGDTREQVVAVLGAPDPSPEPDDPDAPFQTLRYRSGALLIALDRSHAVERILLSRREGGALAGIRVGDRLGALLRSWGEPTSSTTKVGHYDMGDWRISVKADLGTQIVLRLLLARTPAQPDQAAAPPAPPDAPAQAGP